MKQPDTIVAVFADHAAAENAVKKLAAADFKMKDLSVVGQGYHTEEKVVGFYNAGDRVRFWGSRGALWGGLWGLFFGGMFITAPVTGPIIVLGYLAAAIMSAVEGAVVIGGVSALGAALYSVGVPKNSVIAYEAALKADNFLVLAQGDPEQVARAKAVLDTLGPSHIGFHPSAEKEEVMSSRN
jgi:hypothetical protein